MVRAVAASRAAANLNRNGIIQMYVASTQPATHTTRKNTSNDTTNDDTINVNQRRYYSSSSVIETSATSSAATHGILPKSIHNQQKIQQRKKGLVGVAPRIRCFSSQKADFYQTLNVDKGADKGTIKKAYFKLAKQYHPDTNKGDEKAAEKFKKVTEAYETLSDDKQRELYDTYGHAGVDPNSGFNQGGGGGNPFGGGFNPFGGGGGGDGSFHFHQTGGSGGVEIDPEELFDAFFGGGRRRPRGPRKGADLQMHVTLPFKDAVFGTKEDLKLRYQVMDNATGRVEVKERNVECDIPAGIDTGMNLRLSGQGAEGDVGAPRGDLLVTVIVEEDNFFHRDGADVHVEVPISVTQAILGGTVDVKTLTGVAEMTIPKGCQPESKLVMRGKGIPYLKGRGGASNRKGNQIVHLKIDIPKKITKRQEELIREFDKEAAESGMGMSGRLAKAAGSAFDSIFGTSNKDSKQDDDKKSKTSKDDSVDNSSEEEKKQHA